MRSWGIDLLVWAGLVVAFGLIGFATYTALRPPTAEEFARQQKEAFLSSCRTEASSEAMPSAMREPFCGCLAKERDTFPGIGPDDMATCRRVAARRMVADAGLPEAFGRAFPVSCAKIEGDLSGRDTSGDSAFCTCLRPRVGEATVRAAMYAYAGGEGDSDVLDADVQACKPMLVFGAPWSLKTVGGDREMRTRLPPALDVTELVFRCTEKTLIFEALQPGGQPSTSSLAFFEPDSGVNRSDVASPLSGARAYQLLHRLAFMDDSAYPDRAVGFGVGHRWVQLGLTGFRHASDEVLSRACPEPNITAPQGVVVASLLPDLWEQIDVGFAALKARLDLAWFGALVCEADPISLQISSDLIAQIAERFPDPSGTFLAVDVPLHIGGNQQGAFSQKVVCAYGEEGGETCYVRLDATTLQALIAFEPLELELAGKALDPVAFASSAAVQKVIPACVRALKAAQGT